MSTPYTNSISAYSVSPSGDILTDELLNGYRWGYSGAVNLTLSFPWSTSDQAWFSSNYGRGEPYNMNGSALTTYQIDLIKTAASIWSCYANVTFNSTVDTQSTVGDIRVAWTQANVFGNINGVPGISWGYFPFSTPAGGDIWFNSGVYSDFGRLHALQALGLSLGLAYHGEYNVMHGIDFYDYAYSIFSRTAYPGEIKSTVSFNPTTPMIYDIEAIQYIYGANMSYNSGNTVYTFNQGSNYFQTIWDGGGIDTIQWNGTTQGVYISLEQGEFSFLGNELIYYDQYGNEITKSYKTVGVAYGTIIENAIGGDANDVVSGNSSSNTLKGGSGNDRIYGYGGADSISGDAGDDELSGGTGNDTINGGAGRDTAVFWDGPDSPDWFLHGIVADLTIGRAFYDNETDILIDIENLYGSDYDDTLIGNTISNDLFGDWGNDSIIGGEGNDTLTGSNGNDTLIGGTGSDTAVYYGNRASYTITQTAAGYTISHIHAKDSWDDDGTDTLREVEFAQFADQTIALSTSPANRPPVLDATRSPALTAIAANATSPGGNTVAQIVVDGSITDPDVATVPEAIVIENVGTSLGTWQFSINGGSSWTTISGVAAGHGLALDANALVRLLPNGSGSGQATFTFRAWDKSAGTSGAYIDYTAGGGAVSDTSDTAAITVTATGTNVNTLPTANALNRLAAPATSIPLSQLFTYWDADGAKGDSVVGFAVKDQTSGGGYLTLDGVRQSELTTFGSSTYGIPIAQVGRWAFVTGPAGSADFIGFSAIDTRGAFNNPVAVSKVTSSQPVVATVDTIQKSITSTVLLPAGTIGGYIDQDDMSGASIDIDYFKISLVGGHRYTFLANAGVNSSDTLDAVTIRLRDAFGNVLQPKDYVASGVSPTFDFIAPGSGSLLYYLAISAGPGNGASGLSLDDKTGEYQISLVDKGQVTASAPSNTPMVSLQTGIDYRYHSAIDPLFADDINNNFGFIGHYIGSTNLDPSYLSPDKAQLYKNAGLRIFSIYEKGGMDKFSYFTLGDPFSTGKIDGFNASKAAKAAGQTEGSAIYFGIDDDPGHGDIKYNLDKLKEYFKGINQGFLDAGEGIPKYTVGIYGAGASIEAIKDVAHLADYGWLAQATGWTGSSTYNNWDIKQVIDETLKENQIYFPQTKDFSHISYLSRDMTQGRSFGAWGDLTLTTDSVQQDPIEGLNSFLTVQAAGVSGANVVAGAQGDSLIVSNGATGNLISQTKGFVELLFNGSFGEDVFTVGPLAAAGIASHTVFFDGLDGNDVLDAAATDRSVVASGGAGDDVLSGGQAADLLTGDSGNDIINGGAGLDHAAYGSRHAAYTLNLNGSGNTISGPEGADTLTGIERLRFQDAHLGFDVDGNAGQVYRLYKAAFARTPDLGGLGGWIAGMDSGLTLEQVANSFIASAEFQSLYGASSSNGQFVTALYLNVMGRAPDAGGYGYWVNQLASSLQTRAQVLVAFSESAENKSATAGLTANGILYASAEQAAGPARGQTFDGTPGMDTLMGSVGADTFNGAAGNDSINGGAGIDISLYGGSKASHTITRSANGLTVSGGTDGTDTLVNVERLKFADSALAFDLDGNAGQTYRLYQAAFDRTPDTPGLSDWIRGMDGGMSLKTVASGFIGSAEFQGLYGANPTNTQFIDLLYSNVLNRAPDQAGYDYWLDEMARGMTRELVLIGFSESTENQAAVLPVIQGGIAYIPV